jgi:hypothetical protein
MSAIQEMTKNATMQYTEMLLKDVTYIPQDKWDWHAPEAGTSVREILTTCVNANVMLAAAIKGEKQKEIKVSTDSDALIKQVLDTAKEVCQAIDSLSDKDWAGTRTMPWGKEVPTSAATLLPAGEMSYHDGQINYIQLLLGDTKFHWMEE